MVCCGGGRAAGDGCVEVHRQRAVAGNTRLLLWCRCWYRGTHVGAVVVLCIRSEEAAARCDLAVCVSLHVWSAGYRIGNEGCASLCTALEQNKTLTSFTLRGMLCSGVCSVQVIGVLWCKCSGAVITGRLAKDERAALVASSSLNTLRLRALGASASQARPGGAVTEGPADDAP